MSAAAAKALLFSHSRHNTVMLSDLTKNYFELFSMQPSFDINLNDIDERFRKLQKEFHPDRFTSVSDQERRIAMQFTAQINEAYQTLTDPLERGSYLLKLNGINIKDETDTRMDTAFLMEQMELREQLETAKTSNHPDELISKLSKTISAGQKNRITELKKCFEKIADDDNKERARELLRELQFFEKMAQQIEEIEDEYL